MRFRLHVNERKYIIVYRKQAIAVAAIRRLREAIKHKTGAKKNDGRFSRFIP
jgi:hypothetical protein